MRRLHPGPPADVEPDDLYADPRRRAASRPWVAVNMVMSADGATAVGGLSGGLGGRGDRAVFGALRRLADVVLVGASTVRAEGYGPPKQDGLRVAVVTMSGTGLPEPLLASGRALLVVPEDATVSDEAAGVPVMRAGAGRVDLVAALRLLAADGVQVVLAEGGPTLNADLLAAGLVDEWCVTLSPVLVVGESPRATAHGPETSERFTLAHVAQDGDEVYLRYVRTQGPGR